MRGVVVGGMVSALEHLGMLDAFDILCGTSAGAFACTYFGARQAELGTRIYTEDLCDSRFIAMRRSISGLPIMNLDYLVDEVIVRIKPLNTDMLLSQPDRLIVTVTEVRSGKMHSLRQFKDSTAVRQALRASSRLPFVAGPPVMIDGQPFVDGAVSSPLPLSAAVDAGATHILALTSLSLAIADLKWPGLTERTVAGLLRRTYGAPLSNAYLESISVYAHNRSVLSAGGILHRDGRYVPIRAIAPKITPTVGRLCRNRRILSMGADNGFNSVMADIA